MHEVSSSDPVLPLTDFSNKISLRTDLKRVDSIDPFPMESHLRLKRSKNRRLGKYPKISPFDIRSLHRHLFLRGKGDGPRLRHPRPEIGDQGRPLVARTGYLPGFSYTHLNTELPSKSYLIKIRYPR